MAGYAIASGSFAFLAVSFVIYAVAHVLLVGAMLALPVTVGVIAVVASAVLAY